MKDFTGKVAAITGAGSGIGQALAYELAVCGARLALSDLDESGLETTVAEVRARGAEVRGYPLDVADRAAVLAHADEVVADFGQANLVVNNAGVALGATVEEMRFEDFDWLLGVNLGGVVNGTKAFLPHLIASGDGYVVNLSSVFGFVGVPTQSAYNAAKFAVRGFTESLREEMLAGRRPVGVSCVHPGGVKTGIARHARGGHEGDQEAAAAGFEKIALTTPKKAAETILRGVRRRSARILIGPDAYVIDAIPRVLASAYQRPLALLARPGLKRLDRN
ncbi:SDR family NAD(P)-dependent oxidoreductase [Amycolatopsis jiangsuensis]|uniref:NADP-dependent 3-hydroxy acid dehydrogenase YdfG n=1 Tax=Amycolatopsis jiangsuensis TaxID=1181879 RepID=A0A840IYQ6_9PSEU|nr:SDR family NAD(P)-dependent oxidoreductase [Amycolatopsis jiangsuensis]MBB4686960.1 NADP-dependent 3-hydroxy acid dehydrogenase YdfG [Amycolatopsis jiangsuensis]